MEKFETSGFGNDYLKLQAFKQSSQNRLIAIGKHLGIKTITATELTVKGCLSIDSLPSPIVKKIPMTKSVLLEDNTVWEYEFINKKAIFIYIYQTFETHE